MSEFPLEKILPFLSNSRIQQDRNKKVMQIPVSLQNNPSLSSLNTKKSD